jgi:hypothetical protein
VKRHPRLQPLSDDHHRALVLARKARRARGPEVWSEIRERFASELEPHFRAEESWLFPDLEAGGELELARRARADHTALRALARGEASLENARAFADRLEAHVRFEEREVFPRITVWLDAYDDAALRGLCEEGAREVAIDALRSSRA